MAAGRFKYRALKVHEVVDVIAAMLDLCDTKIALPGACLASDQVTDANRVALEGGFRWVRSEEGFGILERAVDGAQA